MCHQNSSASSPLALKFGSLKALTSNYFQVFNSHVSASAGIAADAATETTSRLDCSRRLSCEAQLGPIIGALKPGDGLCTWKSPLLPRGKISSPGRLVKALGHHKMHPNALPDMRGTMFVKKPTRRPTRILTPNLQKSTALLTSLEERTLLLVVANRLRMMQGRCK